MTTFNHHALAAVHEALLKPRSEDLANHVTAGPHRRETSGTQLPEPVRPNAMPGQGVNPGAFPSAPDLDEQVDITREVIRARRQSCYGALQITDDQIDELARAVVQHLSLAAHNARKGE